jgi:hypothetical protein
MVSTCWRVLGASADYPRLIAFLKAMEFSSLLPGGGILRRRCQRDRS